MSQPLPAPRLPQPASTCTPTSCRPSSERPQPPPIYRGFVGWDVPPALEMMDRQGIATAILAMVMSPALFAAPDDTAAARHLARSANEAAAAVIHGHPDRFGAFASLPLPDIDGALAEIDYALGTLGLDGVVLLTTPTASTWATTASTPCSMSSIGAAPWCSCIRQRRPVASTCFAIQSR